MRDDLRQFLDGLYARGREFDAQQADRQERLRNVEPATAALLALLVRVARPARLLELGTSNGLLHYLARRCGSRGWRYADQRRPRSSAHAAGQENLAQAGLRAELRTADAGATLAQSADNEYGFIFLDAERPHYPTYWEDLVRVLAPGGVLAVDNVLSHADQVAEFRALVRADERVIEALAPTGAGALLITRA